MSVVLTPVVFLWIPDLHMLLLAFAVYGFFVQGLFSWMPIWLPELYPTRMRATAIAICFNAPRLISWLGPLVAGSLIVSLGGYGRAASIVGLFYILGALVAPFLPETNGKPLPETVTPSSPTTGEELRQPA
jgi:MFS family permease